MRDEVTGMVVFCASASPFASLGCLLKARVLMMEMRILPLVKMG